MIPHHFNRSFVALMVLISSLILMPACKSANRQQSAVASTGEFTHVITVDTKYYVDGPQQAPSEDGVLLAGTNVRLIEPGSSYSLIDKPVRAYVFNGDLEALD